MKIVQVQTQAEAGGAQHVSDMLGAGLRARGHDVRTVFMYRKTDAYDGDAHADFVLDRRPSGPLDLLRSIVGLQGYMRRARPDAVISFQHYGNIFGTIAARLSGARHVIANQSAAPGKFGGPLIALADRLFGRLGLYQYSVVNSAWTAEQFADYPPAYRQRVRRIDHGVEVEPSRFDRRAARAAFGLPDDAYVMVSTGRLAAEKNQRVLVEALADLPSAHLALAGVGPEHDALLALADGLGVSERLHLLGEIPRNRIGDGLASGDVFVFASRTETFGLSVAEAALAGLPVVANDLPVLHEVLGDAAVYVDADEPGQMAAAIRALISDPARAAALAEKGRALGAKYSPAVMCRAYEELLAD
jgi:glycosyltransferase involved in cell wall biosynthesis